MCGIYGQLSLSLNNGGGHYADIAINGLKHRGPDDQGAWHSDGIFLGMRRLSIIDLTSGCLLYTSPSPRD